jgi:hypothetical protein
MAVFLNDAPMSSPMIIVRKSRIEVVEELHATPPASGAVIAIP